MKNNVARRVAASVAAASALAAPLLTGSVANTLLAGNCVVFGGSFATNPGQSDPTIPSRGGYPISVSNIGSHVTRETGLGLHGYSCSGTTAFMPTQPQKSLMGQVNNTIAQGSLGSATQLVTIYIDVDDAMQGAVLPMPIQDGLYVANVVTTVKKIRVASPTAHVMLVDYPALTSSGPTHYTYPVNAAGFAPRIPAVGIYDFEMILWNRQQRAANGSDIGFINMKEVAHIGTVMCSPDGERRVSAIPGTDVASYNMTSHPTFHGSAVTGTTIVNVYRSTF